jgi:molybdopterin/thiamine biosynthesis adenylyltransferase/rhodanese-related sulfurtransferase
MTFVSREQVLAEALEIVGQIGPDELSRRQSERPVVLIDCRETNEFPTGVIPGAHLLPRATPDDVTAAGIAPQSEIVVYCASGVSSLVAARKLHDAGFTNATSLAGGIQLWGMQGRPVEAPSGKLTADQRQRYARHLVLPEVGEKGQQRLLDAKVAIVGAGGLGSPVALYLAAAGVGHLAIIDHDVVDLSNLQRQILHGVDRVGRPKVESASQTIAGINPDVEVIAHRIQLQASNVLELLGDCDLIVDGADNFPTRYLINDASLHLRVPVVHGSIFRFEGQASVFVPYSGPCYRCLFAQPPPPELSPNCAEAGVFGVLPGIIGSIQAMEAIKLLLGIGDLLAGRLLIYDALEQDFSTVRVKRNPECPACADPANPPPLVDYDASCRPAGTNGR